jgi:hypothetical protein
MHGVKSSLPERVTTFLSVLGSLLLVKACDLSGNSKRPKKA